MNPIGASGNLFTYNDVNNSSCYLLFSAALEAAALSYLKAHFTDGVTSVFSPNDGSSQYVIQIVANKYNPTNFWSVSFTGYNFNIDLLVRAGRWRSEYIVDLTSNRVSGKMLINIHYYEQGNVRFLQLRQCGYVLKKRRSNWPHLILFHSTSLLPLFPPHRTPHLPRYWP